MKSFGRRLLALMLALIMVASLVPEFAIAAGEGASPGPIVLYGAYGGGGNSRSTYTNDYIVLKNIGKKTVNLTGWKVERYSASGNLQETVTLSGSFSPEAYYVMRGGTNGGGTLDLPRKDLDSNINMSATSFSLKLLNPQGQEVDVLGTGKSKIFLGTAMKALSNTTAAKRVQYTGDNAKDWEKIDANEGHLAYLTEGTTPGVGPGTEPENPGTGETPTPVPGVKTISIADARDAAQGTEVTVEGVVTYQHTDGNVFIQDKTGGIGVYPVASTSQLYGRKVRVTGKRGEYSGQAQISQTKVEDLGAATLPEPELITLAQLKDDASVNGQRVLIKGLTLGKIDPYNTSITQDGITLSIFRLPKGDYKETDVVNVIGVAGTHNSKAQLRVQAAGDVTIVDPGEGPAPVDPLPKVTEDPLTDEKIGELKKKYPDLLTISDVHEIYENYTLTQDKETLRENVTIVGVATYAYAGGSSLIIEDVVDGEVLGYQIYGPTETVVPGDIVVAKGNLIYFYGLPEMSGVTSMEIAGQGKPVAAQELTFKQINAHASHLVNEYVTVKDVTLPTYNGDGTITFTDDTGSLPSYRSPQYPLGSQARDVVDIRGAIAPHKGNPQIRMNDSGDYLVKDDKLAPYIVVGTLMEARGGLDYPLYVDVLDNVGATEVILHYEGKDVAMKRDEITGKWKATIPGADLLGKGSLSLSFTAVDAQGNTSNKIYNAPFVYGKSEPVGEKITLNIDNRPQIVNPSPKNLAATGAEKRPVISAEVKNVSDNAKVTISLNGGKAQPMTLENGTASYRPESPLEDGLVEVLVKVQDGDATNELSWKFYVGERTVQHYRGQIHSHSNYSDGAGTPEDAVEYASMADAIDFFALTDHSNYFDKAGNLGEINDETKGLKDPADSSLSKWQKYKKIVESYTTEGFLAMYGYEMTWTKSGANYGHMNTFNTKGFVSRNNEFYNNKTDSKGLLAYYNMLKTLGTDTFSQFNHPGTTFGTFDDFAHYDPAVNENVKLLELGNGEGPIHGNGYFPSYREYTKALDMGWKLAPSINQDNHKGKWGDANDGRTVVIASSLTKSDIISAIRNLNVYASEDKDITVDYAINGEMMGAMVEAKSGDQLQVNIDIAEVGDESIGTIEVVTAGGKVLHSQVANGATESLSFELENTHPYYFVEITQPDGDHIFTAPIWTEDVVVKGITSFTPKDGNGATVGVEKEFSFEFAAEDETIESTTVTDGKTQIGTAKPGATSITVVPRVSGEREYTLTITTDKGSYTRTAKVVVYPENLKPSTIADAWKAAERTIFQIEGTLTSNGSDFNKNTAFFDAAYIQDGTGGINIFPFSGNYQVGDRVRIKGMRSSYQGEGQINVYSVEKLEGTGTVEAKVLKTGEVAKDTGLLVKTQGTVTQVNEDVSQIVIDDGSGPIRIFIDGYIGRGGERDKTMPEIKVGDLVSAVGLSSVDPNGNRIRIRDRNDVTVEQKDQGSEGEKPHPETPETPEKPETPVTPERPQGPSWMPSQPILPSQPEAKPEVQEGEGKEEPEIQPVKDFIDVSPEDWYAEAVEKIVATGIMKGISEDSFGPKLETSRAMMITMLYRMAGEPQVAPDGSFQDVEAGSWYHDAVVWAAQEGITQGLSEGEFGTHISISREDFVTMVHRYLLKEGLIEEGASSAPVDGVSPWAQESMAWAVAAGIIQGRENGDLAPQATTNRAEVATIVLRVMEEYSLD
ncbi:MAG: CehA/McbA family metallohydrolase [Tissierellia bacterium]|nr:CehA/McbA family metallohydrolase [Tissierellia bacterium]